MNRLILLLIPIGATILLFVAGGCVTTSPSAMAWEARLGPVDPAPESAQSMYQGLRVKQVLIPKGRYGRRNPVSMEPRFITIHSTQNPTGNAFDHAKALNCGALRGGKRTGYLFWHFTVQQDLVVQHLPTNEAGEHADMDGPGNRTSIGIEMAEHAGNDLARTVDRSARLTAVLMRQHTVPIANVVPHYHWPREGYNPPNKNCPHFLLENGKPGKTWQWFRSRVRQHYARIEMAETLSATEGWSAGARPEFQLTQLHSQEISIAEYLARSSLQNGARAAQEPTRPLGSDPANVYRSFKLPFFEGIRMSDDRPRIDSRIPG